MRLVAFTRASVRGAHRAHRAYGAPHHHRPGREQPTHRQFPNRHICLNMFRIWGMRGFLASSIGVSCATALAVPLAPPA
ncbi:N-acetylmuramoyl-L-alanine amidase, partial [Streptomyces sp. A13(2022)]|nr:N-acetylmuramoyl-L-alanine amidase [Streptomyces sp. A13(2022)]